MKKKQLSNIIMVAIIVVIVAAGILTAGYVKGWFDSDSNQAVLTEVKGIVNIQRDGVAFPVKQDTPLRQGDQLTCDPGATATIRLSDHSWIAVGEKAKAEVIEPAADGFVLNVSAGEAFAFNQAGDDKTPVSPITIRFQEEEVKVENAAIGLSVLKGSQNLDVYAGTVNEAKQGQRISWVDGKSSVDALGIKMLNNFAIDTLRKANAQAVTCYSDADLDGLVEERRIQMQDKNKPEASKATAPSETTQPTKPAATEATVGESDYDDDSQVTDTPVVAEPAPAPETQPAAAQAPETQPAPTQAPETVPPTTAAPETEPPTTAAPETEPALTVSLSIVCNTILDNMGNLDPAKVGYVPSDGWILYAEVEISEGETVFDVLQRACSDYGIQMEYSYSPTYGSNYIEGINNLYEMDCGSQSGWMYKVDGWFPNYGVSAYTLSGGEDITFCYTCNGLGADVGAG